MNGVNSTERTFSSELETSLENEVKRMRAETSPSKFLDKKRHSKTTNKILKTRSCETTGLGEASKLLKALATKYGADGNEQVKNIITRCTKLCASLIDANPNTSFALGGGIAESMILTLKNLVKSGDTVPTSTSSKPTSSINEKIDDFMQKLENRLQEGGIDLKDPNVQEDLNFVKNRATDGLKNETTSGENIDLLREKALNDLTESFIKEHGTKSIPEKTSDTKNSEAHSTVANQSTSFNTSDTAQLSDPNVTTTDISDVTGFTNPDVVDAIDFLKNCQNVAIETVEIGKEIGRGNYGAVFKATTQFLGQAIQLVKKGFFYPKMGANELYIQYRVLQYVTEHFDELSNDPFWSQSVNSLALALLSKEQNQTLSQAKSPKELMGKIESMMNNVTSSMRTAMKGVRDPNQRQEIQEKFSKEVNNGFFLQFKPGKSLESDPNLIIQNCPAKNRGKAFQSVLSGACLLDQVGVIHRDIRGANIQANVSSDKVPSTSLLDPGIGLDARNLDIYDEKNKEQKALKHLVSIHCSPPEAFPDGLEKGWKPTDPKNEKVIFNPETYNAYGIGTLLPSMYYGQDGQAMIDSYFLTFERYAQHLSDDLVNNAKQIVDQLPDEQKEFGTKFEEHAKKLSEVVNQNPNYIVEDYLNQIKLYFKQLPPERAKILLETSKKLAAVNTDEEAEEFLSKLDEDVKKDCEQLAKLSFGTFKKKFFGYFPADVDPSKFLSRDSKSFLEEEFFSGNDILGLLPNLIEKDSVDTETIMGLYGDPELLKKFGSIGDNLSRALEDTIREDKKHLTEFFGKDNDKISEFNELFSDTFQFYNARHDPRMGAMWNPNSCLYNRAKVWSRKQYFIECEENFKKLNLKLQEKGIESYSSEEIQKQVDMERELMNPNPADRKSCKQVLEKHFDMKPQIKLE